MALVKEKNNPSNWETKAVLLIGLALLVSGVYVAYYFMKTIGDGAAYIFIAFLPAPMIIFGLYAIISAGNDTPSLRKNIVSLEHSPIPEEGTQKKTKTNALPMESQIIDNNPPQNTNSSIGETLVYSFIVFGILIILIITIASTVTDLNKGITHVCPRSSSCYDVFLKDSSVNFYISLILNSIKILIFPVFLAFFVKKWLNSKN